MTIEPVHFAKGSDSVVEGWGMPYFGPFAGDDGIGRDFEGEYFSPRTDFLFDWFRGERPTLYQHTWDRSVGTDRLGGVTGFEKRDQGVWVQAQLDIRSRWYEAVRELIGSDGLSFSSGAYPGGVAIEKSGEIVRWPWVEMTLTPSPMNPYASVAALKSMDWPPFPPLADTSVPDAPRRFRIIGVRAMWSSSYISALPDGAFACLDGAERHYPHHNAGGGLDLPHLRAALSRLGDPGNVQCGRRHLEAHARAAGVGE